MIPILYETTETLFASNGLGRLRDMISCVVTEERNGIYELDFEYPVSADDFDMIQVGRIIGVTHDETGDVQPFDIVGYERPIDGVVTFHCTHISYRQSYMTVIGSSINSLSAAFTRLRDNATPSNPFAYWTDKTSTGYVGAFDGLPHSVRSMLGGMEGSILDAYGGEYEWDGWTVKLHSARGQYRDFAIRYGVNMVDYNEDYSIEGTYSSVIPYWTDGETSVVGSKVDSTGSTVTGRGECVPLDLSDKFEDKPTAAQVQSAAASYLSANNPFLPVQNIEVSFVRLQDSPEYAGFGALMQCQLCDTIKVIFPDYNSSGTFKIVKTEWNVLTDRYESMELGALSTTLAEALGISSGDSHSGGGTAQLNFIQAHITSNQTISSANTMTILDLSSVTRSAGSKLTLNTTSHKIEVGAGVNYVRISGSVYIGTMGTSGGKNAYFYVNESIVSRTLQQVTANYNIITPSPVVVPVSQGDTISLRVLTSGTTTQIMAESNSTKLVVEVVG